MVAQGRGRFAAVPGSDRFMPADGTCVPDAHKLQLLAQRLNQRGRT